MSPPLGARLMTGAWDCAQCRSKDGAGSGSWTEGEGDEGACADTNGESGTGIAAGELGEFSPGTLGLGAGSTFSRSASTSFPSVTEMLFRNGTASMGFGCLDVGPHSTSSTCCSPTSLQTQLRATLKV